MKNIYKYLFCSLLVTSFSCSSQLTSISNDATITDKSLLGPKGGGTIDPKITSGQTILNYKRGFNTLVLTIKLGSSSSFTTKDASTSTTDTSKSTTTNTNSNDTTKSEDSLDKITTEISVNGEETKFDINKDKLSNNEHKINITGLKDGDIINAESRAYDKNGKIVGSENIKDKKIDKEFDSIDFNINLSINITNTNTQNVTVNQSQTVTGPNITINLPQPQNQQPQNPQPQTPPPQPNNTTTQSINNVSSNCITPSMPDHKVVLSDNSTVIICPKPELRNGFDMTSCLQPDSNFKVTLKDGKVLQLCPPN